MRAMAKFTDVRMEPGFESILVGGGQRLSCRMSIFLHGAKLWAETGGKIHPDRNSNSNSVLLQCSGRNVGGFLQQEYFCMDGFSLNHLKGRFEGSYPYCSNLVGWTIIIDDYIRPKAVNFMSSMLFQKDIYSERNILRNNNIL